MKTFVCRPIAIAAECGLAGTGWWEVMLGGLSYDRIRKATDEVLVCRKRFEQVILYILSCIEASRTSCAGAPCMRLAETLTWYGFVLKVQNIRNIEVKTYRNGC